MGYSLFGGVFGLEFNPLHRDYGVRLEVISAYMVCNQLGSSKEDLTDRKGTRME